MHICFLTSEYPPFTHGGIGVFTQTVGRALVSQGYQITVIGMYSIDELQIEDDEGVTVIRIPFPKSTSRLGQIVQQQRSLWKHIREVHSNTPIDVLDAPELSFGLLPPLKKISKVIRMQGGHHFFSITLGNKPRWGRALVEKLSFARADAYCAITNYIARTTLNLLHKEEVPVTILPNPVNTTHFSPLPVDEIDNLIVFVGTVTRKKGVYELVEAMQLVVKEIPSAMLWIIGRDHNYTIDDLQKLIPLYLKERIIFKGPVAHRDLPKVLSRAQIYTFPSYMEGQGIVVIEGMAMGKAVVTSNTGPGPEIIEHEVTGLLCDPYNPESIAEQIIRALSDSGLRKRLGKAARQKVEETYSLDIIVQKNIQFYEQLIEK